MTNRIRHKTKGGCLHGCRWPPFLCYSRNFYGNLLKWLLFGLSRCLPSESIFFKVASALNTSVVANCRFSMVTRPTNDILTRRLLQLYFLRTFQQISFSGNKKPFFDAYQVEGQFFGSPKFRGFSIKICSLKTE